ncbi:MAG TPA: hypothetical protein VF826_12245 [Chloroflexia bacterium]|jgi:hypothetical protein
MADRRANWCNAEWWEDRIRSAITTRDPVLCNLRITLAHHELSMPLRHLLGEDTGANFHTWAVWGSKKAGKTIRQEDIPALRQLAVLLGGTLGGTLGALAAALLDRGNGRSSRLVAAGLGAGVGGWVSYALADKSLDAATRSILGGNITVLEDIGDVTARFVCAFYGVSGSDPQRLNDFLSTLRLGPTEAGGQDLLREAFTHYYLAWHERDLNAKHEHMLYANLKAILHEHIRLQPYIAGAMPRLLRRWITSRLLNYQAGMQTLRVDEDILPWHDPAAPTTLQHLENPDLVSFLGGPQGWDRTPDSYAGSRAANWAEIRDRMNYISDLFRSRHFDPGLFAQPYAEPPRAKIKAGRVPTGPL